MEWDLHSGSEHILAWANITGQFCFVDRDGGSLTPRGRKSLGILIHLLCRRGKKVHREHLIDLFWSDRGEPQGRASLRQAFSEIRSVFGPLADELLSIDRQYAVMWTDRVVTDFWDADGGIRVEKQAPLLEGLGPIAPEFDDWLDQERRQLRADQVRLAERLIAKGESDSTEVLEAAEALLRLEPENELAARAVITGHGLRNNYSRARQVYNDLASALATDGFGVGPATQAAFEQLGQPVAAVANAPELGGIENNAWPGREPPTVCIEKFSWIGLVEENVVDYLHSALGARATDVAEFRCIAAQTGAGTLVTRPDYSVTGNLAAEGDTIELTANAIASETGEQISSLRIETNIAAPISAMPALVDRVIAGLLPGIEHQEYTALSEEDEPWGYYHHYLHAKSIISTAENEEYMDLAEPHLREAVALNPFFLPPYPYLIGGLNSGGRATRPGLDTTRDRENALELARRFLLRDARNPNAHLAHAWCLIRNRLYDQAEQALYEAVKFRPYEANRVNSVGTAFVVLGEFELGEKYYALAREMMVHDLDFMNTDLGELHYMRRDYEKALLYLNLGEARNPNYARCLRCAALAQLGKLDEARQEAKLVLKGFEERWSGSEPFSPRAAIRWFIDQLSIRRQTDLDNFVEGLTKAGFSI